MLKQDVLDCVHSKVRHYAIHQTKNVCFRLNPHLYGTEDLGGAINELQYVPDFEETSRLESEVYGENYGLKYPRFTIPNMKEYKFWPFVAGNEWKKCSSLRVTPGSLLTSLVETYRFMEDQGKILRYTTNVYENVVTHKPDGCIKKPVKSKLSVESTIFTDAVELMNQRLEMTKISFTYYGVSISHLKEILEKAGLDDVTDEEIALQNPGFVFSKSVYTKRLKDIVKENPLKLAPSYLELKQEANFDNDIKAVFSTNTGRRKNIGIWKFTQGKIHWIRHHANQGFENNIMNPLCKVSILEKKRKRQALLKRRLQMHQDVEKLKDEPGQAYRTWWLQQSEDPLMMTESLVSPSQLSFFGNSWILKGNLSSSDSNVSLKPVKGKSKGKKEQATMKNSDAKPEKAPMMVNNFAAVDRWRCECDVCTGNLFNYKDVKDGCESTEQTDDLTDAGHDNKPDFESDEIHTDISFEGDKHFNEAKSVKLEARVENKIDVAQQQPKKGKAVHKETLGHKKKKITGKKGKALRKTTKSEKPKLNPKIWWETVSEYTTPKWKPVEEILETNTCKTSQKCKKPSLTKKLNLSYSFEKLRLRKPIHNKNIGGHGDSTEAKNTKSSSEKCEITTKSISDSLAVSVPSDKFNINALMTHNIIYKYKRNETKQYTKLRLPGLESLQSAHMTESLEEDNHNTVKTEEDKMREALPKISPIPIIEHTMERSKSPTCWTTPSKYSGVLSDSCRARINSSKTSLTSVRNEKRRDELYFLHCVPENFPEMCFAALSEFVIRIEAVITSVGYQRVESLTVNRTPLCSYRDRERAKNAGTKIIIPSPLDNL